MILLKQIRHAFYPQFTDSMHIFVIQELEYSYNTLTTLSHSSMIHDPVDVVIGCSILNLIPLKIQPVYSVYT